MHSTAQGYVRLAMVMSPGLGSSSFSWRFKEALEAAGNTVFAFTPHLQPWLFDDGCFRMSKMARFAQVQRPDAFVFADGVLPSFHNADALAGQVVSGVLLEKLSQAETVARVAQKLQLDFAICADRRIFDMVSDEGILAACELCAAAPDQAYLATPLANTIAYAPGLLCLQDATPMRVEQLRSIASSEEYQGLVIRCFGEGWPSEWSYHSQAEQFNAFAYAVRSSAACVVFDDASCVDTARANAGQEPVGGRSCHATAEDGQLSAASLALVQASGCKIVHVGAAGTAPTRDASHASSLTFDHAVQEVLAHLRAYLCAQGSMLGTTHPRTVVSVLAYVGAGNFGDEYILSTIDKRLRHRIPGASVIAVGENPEHTLVNRGIYALPLDSKASLDGLLAYSSASLVIAGLLFDQGIRWTMGKAELFSNTLHTDIPGIASYALLSSMNNSEVVFYGIGAGPLEDPDSKRLVALTGKVGALFSTRDKDTENLLLASGVPSAQVQCWTDSAFLGECERTSQVDAWLEAQHIDLSRQHLLAVSLRDYENLPDDFAARVAGALDEAHLRHPDIIPVLCLLDPSDERIAGEVQRASAPETDVRVFDPGESIEATCDMIARAYAGLSMRYHCSVVLNAMGKPCVGIGYLPKVASLYEDMGASELLMPVDASKEDLTSHLNAILDNYSGWSRTIQKGAQRLKELSACAEDELVERIKVRMPEKSHRIEKEFYLFDRSASERHLDEVQERLNSSQDRINTLQAELNSLRSEMQSIKRSRSFRLGLALTSLPRKAKACFTKRHS